MKEKKNAARPFWKHLCMYISKCQKLWDRVISVN